MSSFLSPLLCEGRYSRLSFTKVWTWIVGVSAWIFLFGFRQDVPPILRDAFLGLIGLHYVKKIPAVRDRIDAATRSDERFYVRGGCETDRERAEM